MMTIRLAKFDRRTWSFIAGTLLILVSLLWFFSSLQNVAGAARSDDERLITIHDNSSSQKVVITKQKTVGEALKQARINLQPYDSVDPSVSTKLTAPSYHINIYRAQPVLVIDGNARQTIMTPYETAKQIAASAERPLYDEDATELSQSSDILGTNGTGLQLTIDRATKFNLVLYGKVIEARTQSTTVGDMIKDKKIELKPEDTLSLHPSTPISPELKVEIWRNGKQTVNEEHTVAFPVQHIQDVDQPVGYKTIKTPGVLGKKNLAFEVEMRNGQEISRRLIQEVVTLQPQQQVEVVGSKAVFSGDFAGALARLRSCEGSYTSNTGNGYYGAYQFSASAWRSNAPAEYANVLPHQAPPAAQDQAAWTYYQKSGWRPWPACSTKLGLQDIYR